MVFVITDPVSVGSITKQPDWSKLWLNTQWLHTDILGLANAADLSIDPLIIGTQDITLTTADVLIKSDAEARYEFYTAAGTRNAYVAYKVAGSTGLHLFNDQASNDIALAALDDGTPSAIESGTEYEIVRGFNVANDSTYGWSAGADLVVNAAGDKLKTWGASFAPTIPSSNRWTTWWASGTKTTDPALTLYAIGSATEITSVWARWVDDYDASAPSDDNLTIHAGYTKET